MNPMGPTSHVLTSAQRWALLFVTTALAAAVTFVAVSVADGAKATVLGTGPIASPSCSSNPDRPCSVEARVTGFQTKIAGHKKPFVSPFNGKVVAWSIKLSKVPMKASEPGEPVPYKFFADNFGGAPTARLSVLKPVKGTKQPTYQLKSQSPVEQLKPFLGSTTTFALDKPLKIGKGQIAALTIPSWAPMFADIGGANAWQSSRKATKKRGPCAFPPSQGGGANVKAGSPQQGINSKRVFGCSYSGNRLLYSASLVRKPG